MVTRLFPDPPNQGETKRPRFLPPERGPEEIRPLFVVAQDRDGTEMPPVPLERAEGQDTSETPDSEENRELSTDHIPEDEISEDEMTDDQLEPEPDIAQDVSQSQSDATHEAAREEDLRQTIDILSRWKEHFIEQARVDSVEVAFMVAEKIITRELERDPQLIHDVIDEAFAQAAESSRMTLTLHPLDRALLETEEGQNADWLKKVPADLCIEEEPSLQRGDCILDSDLETIDGRLQVRLEALAGAARQALAPAPQKEET